MKMKEFLKENIKVWEYWKVSLEENKENEEGNHKAPDIKRTNVIEVGPLTLDLDRFEVMINNKVVDLTLREFEVLKYLANQPGQVVTRET